LNSLAYLNNNFRDNIPYDAMNLLEGMLQVNPQFRISARDAINHSFFDEIRDTYDY
jgi:serine/threonine protein kinase